MRETVYVETTIPSAYVSVRTDAGSVYRRDATREWWTQQSSRFSLRTSQAVVDEIKAGIWPGQDEAASLIADLPQLEINEEVVAIAESYIRHMLMPAGATGDALHLATACVHEVDYLLTWNIRHLANPNKLAHMVVLNRRLGLISPAILSPEGLWIEEET